jgi:broad specificity phosphatase PhoE
MIYLVRHGQTSFNAEGRFQGHNDSPLTQLGEAQARAAGHLLRELLSGESDWRIVASPLGRARRTAEIIAEITGLDEIAFDDRLKEITLGSWDGLTRAEIDARAGTVEGHALKWWFLSPDGEAYDAFEGRLSTWLEETKTGGRVIAVSHGGAGRMLRGLYAGLTREQTFELDVPQDAIFRLFGGSVHRFACGPA